MTVANVLLGVRIALKLNPNGSFISFTLTLPMRILWSSVWSEFSSVGREEWYEKMKNGQNLKLGDAHVTPRYIQEVQASNLEDAQGIPFFTNKNIRSFLKALHFLLLLMICVILGASLFLFPVLFCFIFCNKWLDPIIFVWRRHTPF